ncbi:MAG TPA: SDR family oxidoreductase [Candidatus Acidoferrales bacterium]|nr:SDR family oxidoreductase [Candidatus Acidoferrales bacterium]
MILVTGAGGTVGTEIVKRLQALGAKFRAAYYTQLKAEEARRNGIDGVALDFAKPDTIACALEGPGGRGVDRVFLISGNVPHQTELELNVVREAKRAGVVQIVKSSVWGVESEAFSFAKIHRPVEKAIAASGIPYTLLRPNGYMQNLSTFYAETIRVQAAFYLPAGDARISHIDVRDLARVAVAVLTETSHAGQAYDLSGPEALTYEEIAQKLSDAAGREISFVDISEADFRKAALSAGMSPAAADALLELFQYYRTGAAGRVSHNVELLTGRPAISFDQYARDYRSYFLPTAKAAG